MSRIDVAIPSYNYARFLPQCLDSVLSQDVDDLRVLVIDNASTDDSLAVARAYAARDPRVEVLARETNLGPHASFNAGVDWACGTYMMILCADDLLVPGALRRAVTILDRRPDVACAYGIEAEWDGKGPPPADSGAWEPVWSVRSGAEYLRDRTGDPMSNHAMGTILVRTELQHRAGHYRSVLRYTDDQEMMLRLANLGGIASTDAVQGIRRLHGNNMSNLYNATRREEIEHRRDAFMSFFDREGAARPDVAALRRRADRQFAATAFWWAARAALRGRLENATELLGLAASVDPSVFWRPPAGRLFREQGRLGRLLRRGATA